MTTKKTAEDSNDALQTAPKNYLIESILATILCCFPFGILGIINATKIENLQAKGDIEGTKKAICGAKKNIKRAVVTGGILWLLAISYWIYTLIQMASGDGF